MLGFVGQFHPRSGGFSPSPSGNFNQNPTPGNSTGLPFRWNWNANNSLGSQNLGLTYTSSSSQLLGTNPQFGPVGSTTPLGKLLLVGKPSITPQKNVGVPPHSVQMQGGTMGPSPQPLGQVPPLSQFQQMGGSNVPLNPSMSYGQGNPQYQQAPQLGPFIPNLLYQQPIIGAGNVPLTATPPGGSNLQSGWNQPGGIYAPGGAQNFGNVPFMGGFNPSQQGGYATPYTNQPGGYN